MECYTLHLQLANYTKTSDYARSHKLHGSGTEWEVYVSYMTIFGKDI